jgi:hypothetical protein
VQYLCNQPYVDPAWAVTYAQGACAEVVCVALAQRRRWTMLRAAWVAAVASAGTVSTDLCMCPPPVSCK